MSLLDAGGDSGFAAELKAFGIDFLVHPSLSEASGSVGHEILDAVIAGDLSVDALCIEGAAILGPQGTGRFQTMPGTGTPVASLIKDVAAKARYVVAVGSCAAFGGIPADGPNHTEARGLQYDGSRGESQSCSC